MHAIIELIPIVSGFFIASIYYFKKARYFRKILFVVLAIMSGVITNYLSKEGIDLLFMDLLISFASSAGFILSFKYLRRFIVTGKEL